VLSARTLEILDLAMRWTHVIAAIMWAGNSMLFSWLDRTLRPSAANPTGEIGDTWLLHSGAFYHVKKTGLVGGPLPSPLHWFKWQAYITWLSGAMLLIVVYYAGGRALLVDPSVASLSHGTAVAIAVGSILLGGICYDALWSTVGNRSARVAGLLSLAALVAAVWALTHLLSGRAAFLHIGALLGTIMAGNVALTIVPSQRALVAGVSSGEPNPALAALAARAKTRSIHNNYLTFPVIALMVSSHFPGLYGADYAWLVLLVVLAAGAAVRHLLNVRFSMRAWPAALAIVIVASFVALGALTRGGSSVRGAVISADTAGLPARVAFEDARSVIDRRCAACHSLAPSIIEFGPAPGGVAFDRPDQIAAHAARIRERAVETRSMPLANRTNMTERERALLGRWIEQGAPLR